MKTSAAKSGSAGLADQITPLVITFNELPNIERTLERLAWARRIVVVDSGSTDGTLELLRARHNVDVIERPFKSFADQCNFGLEQVATQWVLSLDADYELSKRLVEELLALQDTGEASAYVASFVYRIHGRPLRGTLYPPRAVLFRVASGRYVDEGHGHRVIVEGQVRSLAAPVYHDDRKPLSRWFASQQRYAKVEADHLLAAEGGSLKTSDRVRRLAWPAPLLVFAYTLFVKGCVFDGWPGWCYALQRLLAETVVALEIIDRRLSGASAHREKAPISQ